MTIGMIGGRPEQFAPLADLYREQARASGHDVSELQVGITLHAFVARTSQQAAEAFHPYYASYMSRLSRSNGMMSRTAFDRAGELDGHLLVGSPAQVTEKVLHLREMFGNHRLLAQVSLGAVPHGAVAPQGLLSRLLSRSLAVCADHPTCVTPAHPVRHEARSTARSSTLAEEADMTEFLYIPGGLIASDVPGGGPLVALSPGWPDSFWRYTEVIPLLTDPGAHGGDPWCHMRNQGTCSRRPSPVA